jgi:hypothetical protein
MVVSSHSRFSLDFLYHRGNVFGRTYHDEHGVDITAAGEKVVILPDFIDTL